MKYLHEEDKFENDVLKKQLCMKDIETDYIQMYIQSLKFVINVYLPDLGLKDYLDLG